MFKISQQHIDTLKRKSREEYPDHFVAVLNEQGIVATRESKELVNAKDKRGYTTQYFFDDEGQIERSVSPEGVESHFELDENGRLRRYTHGASQFEFVRNGKGQIEEIATSKQARYLLERDQSDRLSGIQYPDNKTLRVEFDPISSSVNRIVDRSGAEVRVVERPGETRLIDPLGRERIYKSVNGELEAIYFPDEKSIQLGASKDGNLLRTIRRDKSEVFQLADDEANDLSIVWPDGRIVLFQYNDSNLLSYVATEKDVVLFEYDENQRIALDKTLDGETKFEHEDEGRLTKFTNAKGSEFEYEYDGDGRLAKIKAWGEEIDFCYTHDGLPDSIEYPGQLRQKNHFELFGRLKSSSFVNSDGTEKSGQSFQYNVCEKLVGFSERWQSLDESNETSSRNIKLHLDDQWRVLGEECLDSGDVLNRFEYDAKGNMTACNGASNEIGLMDELIHFGGQRIHYDELDNMVELPGSRGTITTEFSTSGLLTKTVCQGSEVRYEYDLLGRRTRKTDGQASWRYGWGLLQLLWEEYRESPDAEPVLREYLYLPYAFEPFAFRENGKLYWMQWDARGAIVAVVDEDGELVWRATYDSFGNATIHIEKIIQPWRLNGQYFDEETGLHYNNARYYSPVIKSYISLDPLWFKRSTTNYSYAANDPWNSLDPTGAAPPVAAAVLAACAFCCGMGALGAVIGAGSSWLAGDDPWAGAVEGGLAAFGGAVGGIIGGLCTANPLGAVIGAGIGSAIGAGIGAGLGELIRRWNRGDSFAIECWPQILWDVLNAAFWGALWDIVFTICTLGLAKLVPGSNQLLKAIGKSPITKRIARNLGEPVEKIAEEIYKDVGKPLWNGIKKGTMKSIKKIFFGDEGEGEAAVAPA